MKANVRSDGWTTFFAHHLFRFHIINQQVDDLVRSERRDHLEINLLDLRHAIGPRFRILGPTQPGRMMWMPLGRHVKAERGWSLCLLFSHRVFQIAEL